MLNKSYPPFLNNVVNIKTLVLGIHWSLQFFIYRYFSSLVLPDSRYTDFIIPSTIAILIIIGLKSKKTNIGNWLVGLILIQLLIYPLFYLFIHVLDSGKPGLWSTHVINGYLNRGFLIFLLISLTSTFSSTSAILVNNQYSLREVLKNLVLGFLAGFLIVFLSSSISIIYFYCFYFFCFWSIILFYSGVRRSWVFLFIVSISLLFYKPVSSYFIYNYYQNKYPIMVLEKTRIRHHSISDIFITSEDRNGKYILIHNGQYLPDFEDNSLREYFLYDFSRAISSHREIIFLGCPDFKINDIDNKNVKVVTPDPIKYQLVTNDAVGKHLFQYNSYQYLFGINELSKTIILPVTHQFYSRVGSTGFLELISKIQNVRKSKSLLVISFPSRLVHENKWKNLLTNLTDELNDYFAVKTKYTFYLYLGLEEYDNYGNYEIKQLIPAEFHQKIQIYKRNQFDRLIHG